MDRRLKTGNCRLQAGDLARESLTLVGFSIVMFYIDVRLALVCMTGAPLIVYPLIRLGQRVRRTTRPW